MGRPKGSESRYENNVALMLQRAFQSMKTKLGQKDYVVETLSEGKIINISYIAFGVPKSKTRDIPHRVIKHYPDYVLFQNITYGFKVCYDYHDLRMGCCFFYKKS